MPAGSIILADVAQHTATLVVACDRCDRSGKYPLRSLIERHGPAFGIPGLLALLSADCPKRHSVSAYDLCGICCPDLVALFLRRSH